MSTTADVVAEYISAVRIIQLTRFCQMAPYVVMLYDHVLTYDQEVEHIWNKPWTLTSVLYIILRYPGSVYGWFSGAAFLGSWSYDFCQVFIIVQGWPACVAVWLVQLILQMRLYALYNKSRKLVMFTGALYIAEIIAMSGILLKANLVVHTSNQPLPGIYICSATDTPRVFYSFWIPPLVYEAVLCSLAIWIGVKRSREYIRPVHVQGHGMRLVDVVVMGNVLYFFGLLLSFATSAAMWQALGPEWIEVPEGFPQASEIIAGCRLILHIRNAGSPIDNTTKTSTSTQVVVHYPMQRLSRGLVLDEA